MYLFKKLRFRKNSLICVNLCEHRSDVDASSFQIEDYLGLYLISRFWTVRTISGYLTR